jgi:porin-like protein
MNPRLIALIPLCAAGACVTSAAAQSSIAVSGIVDLAARHVSNEGVGSSKSLVSGSNSTSRLIFSGREDLGDGLSASFHFEHGLLADTGTQAAADKFWDRRALGQPDLGNSRRPHPRRIQYECEHDRSLRQCRAGSAAQWSGWFRGRHHGGCR